MERMDRMERMKRMHLPGHSIPRWLGPPNLPIQPILPSCRGRSSCSSRPGPLLHIHPVVSVLVLVFALGACDGRLQRAADKILVRSQPRLDSLSRENERLRRQMVLFERISAEKDTLLREVRDAHILIETVAQELHRMNGSTVQAVSSDSFLPTPDPHLASADSPSADAVVPRPSSPVPHPSIEVESAGEIPAGEGSYRDVILRKLEGVRTRLAELEDSSRARGRRLLEAARDNERLRDQVEAHLRTIEGQKEVIATYLIRIAELETEVTALADSARRLTEANGMLAAENGVLSDSLGRLTWRANAAWYVVGTREQLVRAGVLTEEGGILGFGRSLAPARAMARTVFTRIDRYGDTVIPLPGARQYRIVSRHDPNLVDVEVSRSSGGALRVIDPDRFWSASAWLIIVYE